MSYFKAEAGSKRCSSVANQGEVGRWEVSGREPPTELSFPLWAESDAVENCVSMHRFSREA